MRRRATVQEDRGAGRRKRRRNRGQRIFPSDLFLTSREEGSDKRGNEEKEIKNNIPSFFLSFSGKEAHRRKRERKIKANVLCLFSLRFCFFSLLSCASKFYCLFLYCIYSSPLSLIFSATCFNFFFLSQYFFSLVVL